MRLKFNGELNVLVPAIEIRKELNSGVLIVKQGESVINRIKWDHFDILATGQSDIHCKIKEALQNIENIGSEKLLLY